MLQGSLFTIVTAEHVTEDWARSVMVRYFHKRWEYS